MRCALEVKHTPNSYLPILQGRPILDMALPDDDAPAAPAATKSSEPAPASQPAASASQTESDAPQKKVII